MTATIKVTIKKQENHFSDGSPCWNAQIWTKVNDRDGFTYCGNGRFCKSFEEAEFYKLAVLNLALERGDSVELFDEMNRSISIAKGLVSLINHNVKVKCPENRVVLDLETMQIDTHQVFSDSTHFGDWQERNENGEIIRGELELYDNNNLPIGHNLVTRESLIDSAKRALDYLCYMELTNKYQNIKVKDYPIDGLRLALERYEDNSAYLVLASVHSICGPWKIDNNSNRGLFYDFMISHEGIPIVSCRVSDDVASRDSFSKGPCDSHYFDLHRVAPVSDKSFLQICDAVKSAFPFTRPSISEEKLLQANKYTQGK